MIKQDDRQTQPNGDAKLLYGSYQIYRELLFQNGKGLGDFFLRIAKLQEQPLLFGGRKQIFVNHQRFEKYG